MKTKNTTGRPRERVIGDGPSRQFLPPFQELLPIPEDLVSEVVRYFYLNLRENDLLNAHHYPISEHCPLRFTIPEGFQHLLLTHLAPGTDGRKEENYHSWTWAAKKLKIYDWFQTHFPKAFRVRLSALPAGKEFDWHIDTNTSVACRCSVSLDSTKAAFEIKARQKVYSLPSQTGMVYFTNTGWPHRVYNPSDSVRLNLVFGIGFEGLTRWMKPSPTPLYDTTSSSDTNRESRRSGRDDVSYGSNL